MGTLLLIGAVFLVSCALLAYVAIRIFRLIKQHAEKPAE